MAKFLILLVVYLACVLAEPANLLPAVGGITAAPLASPPLGPAYAAPFSAAYTAPAASFVGYNAPFVASSYGLAAYTAPSLTPAVAAYTNLPLDSAFASQRLDIYNNHNLPVYAPVAAPPAKLIATPDRLFAPAPVAPAAAPARLVATPFPSQVPGNRYIAPAVARNVAPAKLIAPAAAPAAATIFV